MKKRYLVPLDGSELGERAIPWAKLLAKAFDHEIEFLRCYEPLASVYMLPEFAVPGPVYGDESAFHEQLEQYLQSQVASSKVVTAHKTVCEGDPALAILDRSEGEAIEAVVMSSHGRGGLGKWLLGSIATKVLRGSTVPVLVINANTTVSKRPTLKKILVPVDGSEMAEKALPQAIALAKPFGASILLYQAVAFTPIGHPQLDAAVALDLQNTKEYLEKLKARYPDAPIETKVKATGPKLGIEQEAENCDLVILTSHGRSGLKRWILGSVTEKLVQTCRTPLMIVYPSME